MSMKYKRKRIFLNNWYAPFEPVFSEFLTIARNESALG